MTSDQFRAALADMGLSQAGFARFAMVDARTVRRWCDGTRAVPGPVVALLRLAAQRLANSRPDTAALNTPAAADARESADYAEDTPAPLRKRVDRHAQKRLDRPA